MLGIGSAASSLGAALPHGPDRRIGEYSFNELSVRMQAYVISACRMFGWSEQKEDIFQRLLPQ